MDGDDALEEVMLFGRDNGHYPTFDLFKAYYAIVDNYTKEIQYISVFEVGYVELGDAVLVAVFYKEIVLVGDKNLVGNVLYFLYSCLRLHSRP